MNENTTNKSRIRARPTKHLLLYILIGFMCWSVSIYRTFSDALVLRTASPNRSFQQLQNKRTENGNYAYFKALPCFDVNGSVVRTLPIVCGASFANNSKHKSETYGLKRFITLLLGLLHAMWKVMVNEIKAVSNDRVTGYEFAHILH